MTRRLSWKPAAIIALAGLAFAASAASLAALIGQAGPLMHLRTLGFADSHDKKAFALLASGPSARDEAAAEARRALALAPYDNTARLRLAYAEALGPAPANRHAIDDLAMSYDLVQYDYTVAAWRIQFALNNWESLTPDLRRAVYAEAMAFGRSQSREVDVRRILQTIKDPQGRLAAALWLHALNN
jgi:hypothetical protein